MKLGVGNVAGVIEKQTDFGMALDAGDRVNDNAF